VEDAARLVPQFVVQQVVEHLVMPVEQRAQCLRSFKLLLDDAQGGYNFFASIDI